MDEIEIRSQFLQLNRHIFLEEKEQHPRIRCAQRFPSRSADQKAARLCLPSDGILQRCRSSVALHMPIVGHKECPDFSVLALHSNMTAQYQQ
jgi:hypothetical protein